MLAPLEIGHLVSGLTVLPAVLPASPLQRGFVPAPRKPAESRLAAKTGGST